MWLYILMISFRRIDERNNLKKQKGFSVVEIIIVLLVISVICFVGIFIWTQSKKGFNTEKITENREIAFPETETIHHKKIIMLKDLGIAENSLGISKVDVCDTRKYTGGFFDPVWGTSYIMTCHLRYIEVFEVSLDRQEIVARLQNSIWEEEFDEGIITSEFSDIYTECLVSIAGSIGITRMLYVSTDNRNSDSSYCATPDLLREYGFASGGFVDTSIIKNVELGEEYKNSKSNNLWVVTDYEYFEESIKKLDRDN